MFDYVMNKLADMLNDGSISKMKLNKTLPTNTSSEGSIKEPSPIQNEVLQ